MHNDGKGGGRQPPAARAETGRQETNTLTHGDVDSEQAALAQLDLAEASVNQYLQERVDAAVVHLRGLLPPEELELLKEQLMEQMYTDPTISELVQHATSRSPTGRREKE